MISLATKEIDAQKDELRNFQSTFVSKKSKILHKNIEFLTIKAAGFIAKNLS